ncbi:GDYXXLXY domain-containing protein [Halalkalibacillus halophilus]|uniref:GDYXXLXY domain-containing protein n=1 Tax=Halalkalibacillus halophilus TaxID=392827 RepID=UPI0004135189|nr:GDYXXLXY domain-containing protein [Halalkalibacillus halophilus]
MKRNLFIVAVCVQIVLLLLLACSPYFLDRFGTEVTLQTVSSEHYERMWENELYLEYEAETVRPENWFVSDEVSFNESLYVLLTPNERGIHVVKAVSNQKLEEEAEDVMVKARYQYQDEQDLHHLNIGISNHTLEKDDVSALTNYKDRLLVTITFSPWGQKRIERVETVSGE